MKLINSSAITKYPINGRTHLAISYTGISTSELATNKFIPIGGVIKPIARLTTITITKCIGSIPTDVVIGNSIGVSINSRCSIHNHTYK